MTYARVGCKDKEYVQEGFQLVSGWFKGFNFKTIPQKPKIFNNFFIAVDACGYLKWVFLLDLKKMSGEYMTPIDTNAYNHLKMAGIHDATLQAFCFTIDKSFEITLHHPDQGLSQIQFEGVSHFGFHNVVQGLIVLNIFAFPIRQLAQLQPAQKHTYLEILMGHTLELAEIDRLIEKFQSDGKTKLVAIESSYGGDICLLCRNLWQR